MHTLFEEKNCLVVIVWQFYFGAISNVLFMYAAPCYLCICTAYLCMGYTSTTTFGVQNEREVGTLYAYTHTPAAMVYCCVVATIFHYQVQSINSIVQSINSGDHLPLPGTVY
jgi:hypothetical protein